MSVYMHTLAYICKHDYSHMHSSTQVHCLFFSARISGYHATALDFPHLWDPSRLWICMPWGAEVVRGCDSKPRKLPGLGHVKRPMYRCIDRASRLRETLASEWLSNSLLTATRSRAVGHQEDTQSFGSSKLTDMYIYICILYICCFEGCL